MSLRIKTFISFFLITLLPTGVLLTRSYQEARRHFETTAFEMLRDQAEELAERLDAFMLSNMYTVQHLSHDASLERFLSASSEQQAPLRPDINVWLDTQVAVNPGMYSALYVMNTRGACLASSERDFIGQDYGFRPYFQEAMRGNVAMTDVFIGVTSNLPGIYAAAPIRKRDDILGALVLKFNADGVFQAAAPMRTEPLQWFVLNRMGILLTHTMPQWRYQSLSALSPEQESEIRAIRQFADHIPVSLNLPELQTALLTPPLGEAITLSFVLEHTPYIGGFAPLTTQDWIVGVSQPTTRIYAFLSELIRSTALIALASLAIIGGAAYGLSTYVLVNPLTRLLLAVERIQQGHYAHRIAASAHDEIGQLARAFDTMAHSLQTSEQDYRTLFEQLPVGVYRNSVDLPGKILRANPALARMFGFDSPQEFMCAPAADYYADPAGRARFLETLTRNGAIDNLETMMKRPDGSAFWAALTATANYDEQGRIRWIDGMLLDISERKRAEADLRHYQELLEDLVQERTQALQASEERFVSFMDHLPAMACITDLQQRLIYVNAPGARLAGISANLTEHPALATVFPSDRAARYSRQHQDILANGRATQFEEDLAEAPNRRHWLTSMFPIRNPVGQTTCVGAISVDITAQKQAEDQLRAAHEEARQAQYDAEDAKRAAEKAQSAAEAANRAKSVFLATMSHELRTPLNVILGYTQLFRHDPGLDAPYRQTLHTIHASGEHLLALINEILDFSKIEANRIELQPAAFSLTATLHTIVAMMRIRAEQKGLTFQAALGDDLPAAILGDEQRLIQILLNLLSNAIKFTEHGQVALRISDLGFEISDCQDSQAMVSNQTSQIVQPVSGQAKILKFEIIDTGLGIAPDKLAEIFEPFRQIAHPHLKSEGTGLGLSISQRLVALMGGTLHVQSTPGAGSRFWFTLALPIAPRLPESAKPIAPDIQAIQGYQGRRRKILIVDDQPHNRDILRITLQNLGFEVSEACDGYEAVNAARAYGPDLILLDLALPGISGPEVLRRIRNIPALRHVPVVAVSASVDARTQQQCLEQGFQNFLAKPVPLDILLHLLQHYLQADWRPADADIVPRADGSSDDATDDAADGAAEPSTDMTVQYPSGQEIQTLHQLARRGNPQEIDAYLQALVRQNPALEVFARKITRWLQEYRMQQIYEYTQHCAENESL